MASRDSQNVLSWVFGARKIKVLQSGAYVEPGHKARPLLHFFQVPSRISVVPIRNSRAGIVPI
jgi:hypothetical protein